LPDSGAKPSLAPPLFLTEEILARYDPDGKLDSFLNDILEFNTKVNIVSRETNLPNLRKIAADCLIPFEFLPPPRGMFFDIGSGAGFPGIVLLLAFREIEGVLFERTAKKTRFLESLRKKYSLQAKTINADFTENSSTLPSSSFDVATMRYVRLDRPLLTRILPLLRPQGHFIYYSSIESKTPAAKALQPAVYHYYLDDREILRSFAVFTPAP
jgi:16S rRNA (guanine527-N7)-methyltransferase